MRTRRSTRDQTADSKHRMAEFITLKAKKKSQRGFKRREATEVPDDLPDLEETSLAVSTSNPRNRVEDEAQKKVSTTLTYEQQMDFVRERPVLAEKRQNEETPKQPRKKLRRRTVNLSKIIEESENFEQSLDMIPDLEADESPLESEDEN